LLCSVFLMVQSVWSFAVSVLRSWKRVALNQLLLEKSPSSFSALIPVPPPDQSMWPVNEMASCCCCVCVLLCIRFSAYNP
jgi:hypothetical protein